MPVNNGIIEIDFTTPTSQPCWVKVFYDNSGPAATSQPIINNASGHALEGHNPGQPFRVNVWRPSTQDFTSVRFPTGDTSLTANQLAQWGVVTRGDVRLQTAPDVP